MNRAQAEAMCLMLSLPVDKLVDIGCGQWTFNSPIKLSPELAQKWISQFNTENRPPKDRNIEKIVNDIDNSYWHLTHQSIAFREDLDANGNPILGDGQNRLLAIIRSGKAISLRIVLGITKQAMLAIDNNSPRTTLDSIRLVGQSNIRREHISTLKFFLGGRSGEVDLHAESTIDKINKYKDELGFVFELIPASARCGITAGVRAAIMRAYHNLQKDATQVDKLKSFCAELVSGEGINNPIISKFRTKLLKQDYGGQGRKAIYSYTQAVIFAVLAEKDRISEKDHDLYPLQN